VVNAPEAVIQALEIEARYKTSFWDALILQAAEQSGASVLCSEDLAAKQSYGTVRVVNPLAGWVRRVPVRLDVSARIITRGLQ
jgi:predicted nucleic acid-binding protein